MSQDLVKALGVTPAEKKASELALEYICSDQVNVDDSFTDHKDSFIAGFKAALELAEVKGMEDTLKFYSLSGRDKYGQLYNMVPSAEDKNKLVYGQISVGSEARDTLTAWRSFRGESA